MSIFSENNDQPLQYHQY